MGSVISGATVWARHGVDGFHDAGMINPASAGRSKRKFEGCERLSELRSPAEAHRGWAEVTPRGARQRRAQWESTVGTACETGPRTHGTRSRKAHGMGRGRGRSGSVRFPWSVRAGTPLWGGHGRMMVPRLCLGGGWGVQRGRAAQALPSGRAGGLSVRAHSGCV